MSKSKPPSKKGKPAKSSKASPPKPVAKSAPPKPAAKAAAVKAQPAPAPKPPPKPPPKPTFRAAYRPEPPKPAAPPPPSNGAAELRRQASVFARAMEQFHAREFRKAKSLFETVATGPSREMVYAARQHIRMCEQRMTKATVELETPEDHYNYAITLINRRDLAEAQTHLQEALRKQDADHFHYALALALGLSGDIQGASTHLQRAIEMQPRNRLAARNDPDFLEIAKQRPLREILFPERKPST